MTIRNSKGFSEFEFLGLVSLGLVIAGLLAHFVFEQSLQVERLNALVRRDGVRLNLESQLNNSDVLKKSAQGLTDSPENTPFRACLLGNEGNKSCAEKANCCPSRIRRELSIFELGDEVKMVAGTGDSPSCLNEKGEPSKTAECFASARVTVETVCAEAASSCRQASAVLVQYQLQFLSHFLKNQPELALLERTLSVVIDSSTGSLLAPSIEPNSKSKRR